jgi:hypothetical protein
MEAYKVLVILKLAVLLIHGRQQNLKCIEQIEKYDDAPLLPLILGKAAGMDESHLLEHSRFAALSST